MFCSGPDLYIYMVVTQPVAVAPTQYLILTFRSLHSYTALGEQKFPIWRHAFNISVAGSIYGHDILPIDLCSSKPSVSLSALSPILHSLSLLILLADPIMKRRYRPYVALYISSRVRIPSIVNS